MVDLTPQNMKSNFLVVEKTPQLLIPELVSSRWQSKTSFIPWGQDGTLPDFIFNVYTQCSVLKALVDFTASKCRYPRIAKSLLLYGMAIIVDGKLLDNRYVRLTSDRSRIQYKRYRDPIYIEDKDATIIALDAYDTYPIPFVYPCLKSAAALTKIADYGLSEISQGFASSALVSLNNGVPDDETRKEIQDAFESRYTGASNAGRIMLSFSQDRDHSPEVHQFTTDDFFSHFSALKDYSYENLFATFRCTPALIGIHTNESSGALSEVEYESVYKLFQEFTVKPIEDVIDEILQDGTIQ